MTIQQWCFSFKGRIGRREFWIWMGLWLLAMLVIFTLAGKEWLPIQSASFALVFLLWPTATVVVKRLHDRNKAGWWALLAVLAWMLMAGNWQMLTPIWQWGVGRFIPTLIFVMMFIDCGALRFCLFSRLTIESSILCHWGPAAWASSNVFSLKNSLLMIFIIHCKYCHSLQILPPTTNTPHRPYCLSPILLAGHMPRFTAQMFTHFALFFQ